MALNEPPYLTLGTEVSARYRGAFCEAKVKKVNRLVKCKVVFTNNLGTMVLPDDQINGILRVNSYVEAKHPEKNQYFPAIISKLSDYSQYTVVFDDGDETTLRRTSLCLKSGRHFAESETLDQLPLTNPEHFGIPVLGSKGRRKRRSAASCSSVDDESSNEELLLKRRKELKKKDLETDVSKVVCVDLGDKRKKDNWFPALIVSPLAQDTIKINPKDQYLVRSFKDGKYYQVKKKDVKIFTKEINLKVESSALKSAVEKANLYLSKDEIPAHWDWDVLMGNDAVSEDEVHDSDVETSDDEPSEEKDRFVAQLYKFMDERGTPINKAPIISNRDLNLYKLFSIVQQMGGYNRVTNQNKWMTVYTKMGLSLTNPTGVTQIKRAYKRFLHSYEDINRKLGCTMVSDTRSGHTRHRLDRNIIMTRKREQNMPLIRSRTSKNKKVKQENLKKEESMERRSRSATKTEENNKQKELQQPKENNKQKEQQQKENKQKEQLKENNKQKEQQQKENNKQKEQQQNESSKQKEQQKAASVPEPKREKIETRGSIKNDQEKSKSILNKEKKKEKVIQKPKEEKSTKEKSPKTNIKEPEKEKPEKEKSTKIKTEDDKEQIKKKTTKIEEKDTVDKIAEESTSDGKPKRPETNVRIGDRVKVKYGKGKQHKKYEAKVLKIERESGEKRYYVHYTGWNMRYDEWIRKNQIVEVYDHKNTSDKKKKRDGLWHGSKCCKELVKRSKLFKLTLRKPGVTSSISAKIGPKNPLVTPRTRSQDVIPDIPPNSALQPRKLRRKNTELSISSIELDSSSVNIESGEISTDVLPSTELTVNTSAETVETKHIVDIENIDEDKNESNIKTENIEEKCVKEETDKSQTEEMTEVEITKEVTESVDNITPQDIVLKTCTVNLSQESRSFLPSDSNEANEEIDNDLTKENDAIQIDNSIPIETPSPDQDHESEETLQTSEECAQNCSSNEDQASNGREEKENSLEMSDISEDTLPMDDIIKSETTEIKAECQEKNVIKDGNFEIINEIKKGEVESSPPQIADSSHLEDFCVPNITLPDDDLPPPLEKKPDLIPLDAEQEIYENQPELKRAISESEDLPTKITITSVAEDCQKETTQSKIEETIDAVASVICSESEAVNDIIDMHSSPLSDFLLQSPKNLTDVSFEAITEEKKDDATKDLSEDLSIIKKEKKKKLKLLKTENNDITGEDTNDPAESAVSKCKDGKSHSKKKIINSQEGGALKDGEIKKKNKKLKLKKKKLKKHGKNNGNEEKDSKESQDGIGFKKEKKKKDDKIGVGASFLHKKGEHYKKIKKCKKSKDKNSPKKSELLSERKAKRKKKKKDASSLDSSEKSANEQTNSDSDKAMKSKKAKKKDKKKSKKKIPELLETNDKPEEITSADKPDILKVDKEEEEKEEISDSLDIKLEPVELSLEPEIKPVEDVSFLLCEEQVPCSPIIEELEEDKDHSSLTLSSEMEQSDASVHLASESSVELYINNEIPKAADNLQDMISRHNSEVSTVLDNTPPTTPESSPSYILSNSPSYDQDSLSPDERNLQKESPDGDSDSVRCEISKPDINESEDSLSHTESAILFLANQAVSRKNDSNAKSLNSLKRQFSETEEIPPTKKRRILKCLSTDPYRSSSGKKSSKSKEHKDVSISVASHRCNLTASVSSSAAGSQQVRTSKFNFYVPLDAYTDPDKRIAILQDSLSELKKTYLALKAEVALIDRHRKKAKKKEKEAAAIAEAQLTGSAVNEGIESS